MKKYETIELTISNFSEEDIMLISNPNKEDMQDDFFFSSNAGV